MENKLIICMTNQRKIEKYDGTNNVYLQRQIWKDQSLGHQ